MSTITLKHTKVQSKAESIAEEARNLAYSFGHSHLTPEHILVVLLRDKLVAQSLSAYSRGAFQSLQAEAESSLYFRLEQGKCQPPATSTFANRILGVLSGRPDAGSSKLLLAFYRVKGSIALHHLLKYGFDEITATRLFETSSASGAASSIQRVAGHPGPMKAGQGES